MADAGPPRPPSPPAVKRPADAPLPAPSPLKKPRTAGPANHDVSPVSAADADPSDAAPPAAELANPMVSQHVCPPPVPDAASALPPRAAASGISPSSSTTPASPHYLRPDPRVYNASREADGGAAYKKYCDKRRRQYFYPVNFNQAGVLIRRSSSSARPTTPAEPTFLFIENLNNNINECFLKHHMASFGRVAKVSIPEQAGRRKGIAMVVFSPKIDGIVQKLHGRPLAGDKLWVTLDPEAKLFDSASRNVLLGTYIGPVEREKLAAEEAARNAAALAKAEEEKRAAEAKEAEDAKRKEQARHAAAEIAAKLTSRSSSVHRAEPSPKEYDSHYRKPRHSSEYHGISGSRPPTVPHDSTRISRAGTPARKTRFGPANAEGKSRSTTSSQPQSSSYHAAGYHTSSRNGYKAQDQHHRSFARDRYGYDHLAQYDRDRRYPFKPHHRERDAGYGRDRHYRERSHDRYAARSSSSPRINPHEPAPSPLAADRGGSYSVSPGTPDSAAETQNLCATIRFAALPSHVQERDLLTYVLRFGSCDSVFRDDPFWIVSFPTGEARDSTLEKINNDDRGIGGRRAKRVDMHSSELEQLKRENAAQRTYSSGVSPATATPTGEFTAGGGVQEKEDDVLEEVRPDHTYLDQYFSNDMNTLFRQVRSRPSKIERKLHDSDDEDGAGLEQQPKKPVAKLHSDTPMTGAVEEKPSAQPVKEKRKRRKSRFAPCPVVRPVEEQHAEPPSSVTSDAKLEKTIADVKSPQAMAEEMSSRVDAAVDSIMVEIPASTEPPQSSVTPESDIVSKPVEEEGVAEDMAVKSSEAEEKKEKRRVGRPRKKKVVIDTYFEKDAALALAISKAEMALPGIATTRSRTRRAKLAEQTAEAPSVLDEEMMRAIEPPKPVVAVVPEKQLKPAKRKVGRPRKVRQSTPEPAPLSKAEPINPSVSNAEPSNEEDDGECARTRVYKRRPCKDKRFLPSLPEVSNSDVGDSGTSAREARQQNRLFRKGVNALTTKIGGIMTLNALRSRGKKTTVFHSDIHNMGLFARERIEPEQFVIEYIGEAIRSTIGDLREVKYQQLGIGDSYLFRLDKETILDATKKGSKARFINHSCDPNVIAKIIKVGSESKIVFYSRRVIHCNEEITYDYRFNTEEEKIPCLCKASNCRKYLN